MRLWPNLKRLLNDQADQQPESQEQDGEVIQVELLQSGFHGGFPMDAWHLPDNILAIDVPTMQQFDFIK